MAWLQYVDNMKASGHVSQGAVLGVDGSEWACSPDLQITANERSAISNGFNNSNAILAGGLTIAGSKFFCLQADSSQIQGKKGANGICIAKAKSCILVALYNDKQQPGNCRNTVEKMCAYLVDAGY